jgi:hypothetical protein
LIFHGDWLSWRPRGLLPWNVVRSVERPLSPRDGRAVPRRIGSRRSVGPPAPIDLGPDSPPVELGQGAKRQIEAEDGADRLCLLGRDFELFVEAAIAERNGSADRRCQPVAFMIAAIVVPLGCRSRFAGFPLAGKITDEELEREPGGTGLRYSFDIFRGFCTVRREICPRTWAARSSKTLASPRPG